MARKNPHEFLQDIVVETVTGKRKKKVIVLNETDTSIVYIPLTGLSRIDYDRLKDMHEKSELDLLTTMRDQRLDNGRNALVIYKNVIQVYNKKQPEPEPVVKAPEPTASDEKKDEGNEPPKRRPGRPKKKVED